MVVVYPIQMGFWPDEETVPEVIANPPPDVDVEVIAAHIISTTDKATVVITLIKTKALGTDARSYFGGRATPPLLALRSDV